MLLGNYAYTTASSSRPPTEWDIWNSIRPLAAATPTTPCLGALPLGSGLRIVEDPYMVETVEDWSDVRSPSRARRRRRRGHPQRIRWITRPKQQVISGMGCLIMHPEMAARLRAASLPLPSIGL